MEFQLNFAQEILVACGLIVWVAFGYRWLRSPDKKNLTPPIHIDIGIEHILFIMLIFLVIGGMAQQIISSLYGKLSADEKMNQLAGQILADLIAKILSLGVIIYLYVGKINFKSQISNLKFQISDLKKIILFSALMYLAIFPVVNVAMYSVGVYIVRNWLSLPVNIQHPAIRFLSSPNVGAKLKLACIVLAAIVSPIAEEIFFRGMLQNWLFKILSRPVLSIVLASIAFMVVHIPMYHQLPALWLLGVILGWSYWRYKTILVPITTHIIFNSVTLIMWYMGIK